MDDASPTDSLEPAAEHLDAEIVARPGSTTTKTFRTLVNLALTAMSGEIDHAASVYDLVVTRRGSGGEILRVKAGSLMDADQLLQHVRRDLESKSVAEFLSEWRLPDA